jgi:lipoprotein signal peptidase
MTQNKKPRGKFPYMPIGLLLGAAVGAAIDRLAFGIAIGIMIGSFMDMMTFKK